MLFRSKDKDNSKLTVQGVFNMYKTLRDERRDLFDEIKKIIDGEDTTIAAEISEMTEEERLLMESEVDMDETEDEEETGAPLPTLDVLLVEEQGLQTPA